MHWSLEIGHAPSQKPTSGSSAIPTMTGRMLVGLLQQSRHGFGHFSRWPVIGPQWIVKDRVNLSVRTSPLPNEPTFFAQQEILAPLEPTKGEPICVAKKDF
jgi:hypothetical protein